MGKILILSDINSIHTIRWVKSLSNRGMDVSVFSFTKLKNEKTLNELNGIKIYTANHDKSILIKKDVKKWFGYTRFLGMLKRVIKEYQPDILHAHYVSSYGLLGALSNFSPFALSIWGSDVFIFPKRSIIHRMVFKYILNRANAVFSTSKVMAKEANKYIKKQIEVIPFGIDLNKFRKMQVDSVFGKDALVVGTVKHLEKVYGIDKLIRSFYLVKKRNPDLPLKLLIVGGGSLEQEMKSLVKELDIDRDTVFTGAVPFDEIPKYLNMLDVYVALSNVESFGVAVLEASACELPVVVSDVGGLPEVVINNETGFIVPNGNIDKAAESIEFLIKNSDKAEKMGRNGREFVKEKYQWENNVETLVLKYNELLSKPNNK